MSAYTGAGDAYPEGPVPDPLTDARGARTQSVELVVDAKSGDPLDKAIGDLDYQPLPAALPVSPSSLPGLHKPDDEPDEDDV